MIKVIHFITGLNTGGAEMMLYKTAIKLNKDKYKSVVISMIEPGPIGEMLEEAAIKVYHLGMRPGVPDPRGLIRLVKILRKEQPHILHCYLTHANIMGRIAAKITKIPVNISSIRNENVGGKLYEFIMGKTDFLVDKVTAVCKTAGETQVSRGATTHNKLKVIYNGIDLKQFDNLIVGKKEKLTRELGIPEGNLIISTVGRLTQQKNHDLLLESFANLVKVNKDCTLLIVGDGSLKSVIENQVNQLNLNNNVIFTGIRTDVPDILSLSDIFVLASSWEGMPNVVLEAMAASTPVIATAVGGTPEIVFDQETGILVKPNEINSLTNALIKMCNLKHEDRIWIGQLGRKRVATHFVIEKTVKETDELYTQLLRGKMKIS